MNLTHTYYRSFYIVSLIGYIILVLLSLYLCPVTVYVLSQLLKSVVILHNSQQTGQRVGEYQQLTLISNNPPYPSPLGHKEINIAFHLFGYLTKLINTHVPFPTPNPIRLSFYVCFTLQRRSVLAVITHVCIKSHCTL